MAPGSRHAIFRRHSVAAKQSVGYDTMPEAFARGFPGVGATWHEQDGCFRLENGSEIWLTGLEDKSRVDKILGREYATLYFNEASEIPLSSYTVALTRLAQQVAKTNGVPLALKVYVDLNPTTRTHWTYRIWMDGINPDGELRVDPADYAWIRINPVENIANLSADYIKSLRSLPERARARFFHGEYTSDTEQALWRRDYIQRVETIPPMRRIVVAIDPAVSNDVGSDETGIVCAGLGSDGFGYVLADESGRFRPEEWARRAVALMRHYDGDRIIAEVNQGGDMVESVLRAQGAGMPVKKVVATRGKVLRAEPIAALYELGRVFHGGEFRDLESQMCSFAVDFDSKVSGYSPDRVDALVYALTELFPAMAPRRKNAGPIYRESRSFMQ